ncbi:MAG: hypothetical protein DRP51_04985 [Candidatus Zixiibacteriota bacterium]|nr:MAG: hypothetical protein DRP51_04985 [candidate division Zixibacteria bacterium]
MKNKTTKMEDLSNLLTPPTPFEMDLPWENYSFSKRFYNIVNDWGIPTEKEVNFIRSYVKSSNFRILDLTCGGGRHALGLARFGYNVTAIDIGGYPVEYARQTARRKGYKIKFIRNDVRKIKYENEFDLAFLICGQLGHFSPADALRIFKNSALALTDSGVFIIHLPVFGPDDMANRVHWYREKRPFYFPHPSIVHREQYYFENQKIKLIRDFAIDTATRKNRLFGISEKNYVPEEIIGFGKDCNFELLEMFGSYDKDPLSEDSSDNIYIFTKK